MSLLAFVGLALFFSVDAHSQQIKLDKALKLPLSPGAVAILVEHVEDERARERLAGALCADSVEVVQPPRAS